MGAGAVAECTTIALPRCTVAMRRTQAQHRQRSQSQSNKTKGRGDWERLRSSGAALFLDDIPLSLNSEIGQMPPGVCCFLSVSYPVKIQLRRTWILSPHRPQQICHFDLRDDGFCRPGAERRNLSSTSAFSLSKDLTRAHSLWRAPAATGCARPFPTCYSLGAKK